MKITKKQLRKIIKEELENFQEDQSSWNQENIDDLKREIGGMIDVRGNRPAHEEQKWNMVFSLDPDEEDAQQEKAVAEYNKILETESEEQLILRLNEFLELLWNSKKEIHAEIDRLGAAPRSRDKVTDKLYNTRLDFYSSGDGEAILRDVKRLIDAALGSYKAGSRDQMAALEVLRRFLDQTPN